MLPPPGFRDLVLCGTGATSRVFRATTAAGRTVALKRIHRQLARDAEALSRLRRELEALGRLQHPAIVPIFDVIRWQGDPTIVMDYVPGRDLKEQIAVEGPVAFVKAERMFRQLLEVLQVAHGAGIVHRDVKPQNVRLTEDGRIFLLDFGSARLDASSQLTATGTSVGTPDYMAPELFAGPVYDPRVDLYGAGATVFEALTGRAPQVADTLTELAWRRMHEDAPRVVTVREDTPERLAQVIDRCLDRAPEDRYASASHALWALDHPAAERRLLARRSRLPPCLHCGAAIPPASNVCPACISDHPFCFLPGHASVTLVAIREPAPLAAELLSSFPELAAGDELPPLFQRLAAVGAAPQRIVSLIDRGEAIALADRLREAGAECRIDEDPGVSHWNTRVPFYLAAALLVGALLCLFSDLPLLGALLMVLPTAGALLAERAVALDRACHGLVSRSQAPVAPRMRDALIAGGPLLAGTGVMLPLLDRGLNLLCGVHLPLELAPALVTAGVSTSMAAVAACFVRFPRGRKPACGSAEPGALEKIRTVLSSPDRSIAPIRRRLATLLSVTVIAMVPLELAGGAIMRDLVPTFWSLWTQSDLDLSTPVRTEPLDGIRSDPPVADPLDEPVPEPAPAPEPLEPELIEPTRAVEAPLLPEWLDARAAGLIGAILALDLALLALMIARRRRFMREGDRLLAEVDRPNEKIPPRSRLPACALTAADRLAERSNGDAFLEATKRRAAELAHDLDPEQIAVLSKALDQAHAGQLRSQEPAARSACHADQSFQARCILESDADLALRFELLRVAGKMEAEAAERWAAALPDETGDRL